MLAKVPEKAFLAQVQALARLNGWRVYHTHSSMHSAKGFPDLVMVKAGRLVFAELKAQRGQTTREQEDWLAALGDVFPEMVEVFVWRPGDWDQVTDVLR